jgi:tetratricopeptide (TPR) repeat protein
MIWAEGKFQFNIHKKLEEINSGIHSLKVSQDGFEKGTFNKLDTMGCAVSSIEVNVQELLFRTVQQTAPTVTVERGHLVIPFVRNGNFVGREGILENVEHQLELPKSNHRVALWGLGGVGKSQIALEVAYRTQAASPGISCFWVSAVSRITFTQSYRQIASSLAIPGANNPSKDVLQLVKSWLQREQTGPWLITVDNVDDLRSLRGETDETDEADDFNLLQYLPQCGHGKLIFTTRSKIAALRLTGGGAIVQIPTMDANEAQQLLQGKLDDDDATKQDCFDLVKALEYLPLPISHAASYIREMDITPARYLRMFNDDQKITKLLKHTYEDLARDGGQNNTVLKTWRISFEQIQRDSPESADMLKIMGSLHWQDIPQYLLQQDKLEDEDDFDDAVAPLLAFSLIQKAPASKMFSMHRLIHIAIRSWAQNKESARSAQKLLLNIFPTLEFNRVSTEMNSKCRQLLPHAQKNLDLLGSPDAFSLMSVQVKFRIASCLYITWQYQEARDLFSSLVAPLEAFSQQGVDTGISQSDLEDKITKIYFSQNKSAIGIKRATSTLETRRRTLPADHPDILRARDLFSLALISQRKYKAAEKELKDTYNLTIQQFQKADILSIAILLSLGAVYSNEQQYQKAADTYKDVLDILVPLYGERNDCVIRCLSAMGDSLRCLYKTKDSGVLIRKALALSEETLGPDHPLTLNTVSRFADQLVDEEDKNAAFQMYERVWKGHQRLYGDDSSWTINSYGLMAYNHPSSPESERLLKIGIGMAKKVSTVEMSVLTTKLENFLGNVYINNDEYEKSRVHWRQLFKVNPQA